jgi:hypothetical protein
MRRLQGTCEQMKQFSNAVRAYVFAVASLGAATILHSIVQLYADPVSWKWLILALLTLLSGSATVKLPSVPATISISETFVITSALLFGTAAGTLTVALDALVISFWLARKGHPTYRIVFNIFALPAALWAGSTMYFLIGSIPPLAGYEHPIALSELLLPLTAFTVVYFGLNSWLLSIAISLERQLSPFDVWRKHFAGLSLNYFGGASIAALLVTYSRDIDFAYLAFILPLLGVLCTVHPHDAFGSVDHVAVRKVYPSTLEVEIVEHRAFAVWQHGRRLAVIDEDGKVIAPTSGRRHANLPLVIGMGAAESGIDFLAIVAGHERLAPRVVGHVRVADRRWDLRLDNGIVIRLPEEGIENALREVEALDREHGLLSRDIASIDMRFADRIVLRLTETAKEHRDALLKQRIEAASRSGRRI